jgi:DNA processing protein
MFAMSSRMASLTEKASVLALARASKERWYKVAALVDRARSAADILEGRWSGFDPYEAALVRDLAGAADATQVAEYRELINRLEATGVHVVTILDADYPANLRAIYNQPPMLFVRGNLDKNDERAVAVVGTRLASPEGLRQAHRLAYQLARRGVTVVSGLARGIDTAAHNGALAAGGRTVAVMGAGIDVIYPAENAALANRILSRGALVSQFWPGTPPISHNFPMRNVVMSGLSVGTVVVEANSTSGAKMQARLALEHGKRVFLIESLVMSQPWAKRYAKQAGATVVRSVDDIVEILDAAEAPVKQLSLG